MATLNQSVYPLLDIRNALEGHVEALIENLSGNLSDEDVANLSDYADDWVISRVNEESEWLNPATPETVVRDFVNDIYPELQSSLERQADNYASQNDFVNEVYDSFRAKRSNVVSAIRRAAGGQLVLVTGDEVANDNDVFSEAKEYFERRYSANVLAQVNHTDAEVYVDEIVDQFAIDFVNECRGTGGNGTLKVLADK